MNAAVSVPANSGNCLKESLAGTPTKAHHGHLQQQEKITNGIKESFMLTLDYSKDKEEWSYHFQVQLANKLNKFEEEIIAAIKYFRDEANRN